MSSEIVCHELAGSAEPACQYELTFANGVVQTDDRTVPWALSRYRANFNPVQSPGNVTGHVDGDMGYASWGGPVPYFNSSAYPVVSASPTIRLRYFAVWSVK